VCVCVCVYERMMAVRLEVLASRAGNRGGGSGKSCFVLKNGVFLDVTSCCSC
jgi:hypothetical protein